MVCACNLTIHELLVIGLPTFQWSSFFPDKVTEWVNRSIPFLVPYNPVPNSGSGFPGLGWDRVKVSKQLDVVMGLTCHKPISRLAVGIH